VLGVGGGHRRTAGAADLGEQRALQGGDLRRIVAGGAGTDAVGLDHGDPGSAAAQQQSGGEPGDPTAEHEHVEVRSVVGGG